MVIANIKNAARYNNLYPHFKDAFAFLKTLSEDSTEDSFVFDGFRGHITSLETSDFSSDGAPKNAEAHKEYLDIHYVIKVAEAIGYADIDKLCPVTEYDSKADYLLLKGEMQKIRLGEGDFCIVFPEDAHAPGMSAGENCVKKAVVKIRIV